MVPESRDKYDSQWAAICSIAPKTGCTPETLRVWIRQYEWDTGGGDGVLTIAERQRLKEPERENRELRRSNDILRQAYWHQQGVQATYMTMRWRKASMVFTKRR